ncbi:hypothetical protein Ais01nite_33650 [Asanoa ishikariensis]|nr:hypothetical protein Ais01nite_33650 [Asanoa ishikariensis]
MPAVCSRPDFEPGMQPLVSSVAANANVTAVLALGNRTMLPFVRDPFASDVTDDQTGLYP